MLIGISWKNLWRNKTRSLIILTSIAIGLSGELIASGLSFGMGEQMIGAALETRLSDIEIHNPEYITEKSVNEVIPNALQLTEQIRKLPEVTAATPRLAISAMASSSVTATGVDLLGIVPGNEQKISSIHNLVIEGNYFESNKQNPVIIGRELANSLELSIGSKIVFTFQNAGGTITGGAFRVVGIFRTVSSQFDKSTVFVEATDLSRLLEVESAYQEIAIQLEKNADVDSLRCVIQKMVPKMSVETWKTLAPQLAYVSETIGVSLYIFMGVILFALTFGIVNTMLMVVLERRREFGMLMAVGMKRKIVFKMILLETVILSFTGTFAGLVITALLIAILSKTGINLTMFSKGLNQFGIGNVLYPYIPLSMIIALVVMVLVASVISAIFPAYQALALKPSEALRLT